MKKMLIMSALSLSLLTGCGQQTTEKYNLDGVVLNHPVFYLNGDLRSEKLESETLCEADENEKIICHVTEINGDEVSVTIDGNTYVFYGDNYSVGETVVISVNDSMEIIDAVVVE